MAAPIVYRWDDANAPVARGERRSLCDILYACLVTGYGDKPAAGWTREYVNATFDKAVFRNNPVTGTGFYLRIDGASASTAYQAKYEAFESMVDLDSGLLPFYSGTAPQVALSNAANTTARPWILIADDRFFYFFCWPLNTSAPTTALVNSGALYFGDFVRYSESDAFACILSRSDYTNQGADFNQSSVSQATNSYLHVPRKSSGAAGAALVANIRGGGPGSDAAPGAAGLAYVAGGPLRLSRPYLTDSVAYTLRGWLPGFYNPCHASGLGQLVTHTVDGKSYLSVYGYVNGYSAGTILISLDDWRA
jgi:hypothetical protein